MKVTLSKKNVLLVVLAVYVLLSAWFIVNSAYQAVLAVIYDQGQKSIVAGIIKEAQDICEPFDVYHGTTSVQLVNVECLRQQLGTDQQQEGKPATVSGDMTPEPLQATPSPTE